MHAERLEKNDAQTVAAALEGRPGLVWLDGEGPSEAGRFSFMASDPVEVRALPFGTPDPLGALNFLVAVPADRSGPPEAPPLSRTPAWIGYIAYDAAWSDAPRAKRRHQRDESLPIAWFGRYDAVVAFDRRTSEGWLLGDDPAACRRLRERLGQTPRERVSARTGPPVADPPGAHLAAIAHALEHIAAGDVYQVNLARRFRAPYEGPASALHRAMRRESPVPFGFFLDAGDHAVISTTMELFLRWDRSESRLETRPIKGTVARTGHDLAEAEALRTNEKERAEHSMIVDLMRNDLGRVALVGSVNVRDRLTVEPYAGLHHLVSTVTCETPAGLELPEILRATFPPGSVTGTPKLRAMELIEALEATPRGVYTGAVGLVDRCGGAHFAVAIRTAVLAYGEARYAAGGGIVEASVPARELEETELKARVFLDAIRSLREEG